MNWYVLAQNRLNPMRFRDLERTLESLGFINRGRNGPHFKFCNQAGRCVSVPGHREIPVGTVRSIVRQTQMPQEQFQQAYLSSTVVAPFVKL